MDFSWNFIYYTIANGNLWKVQIIRSNNERRNYVCRCSSRSVQVVSDCTWSAARHSFGINSTASLQSTLPTVAVLIKLQTPLAMHAWTSLRVNNGETRRRRRKFLSTAILLYVIKIISLPLSIKITQLFNFSSLLLKTSPTIRSNDTKSSFLKSNDWSRGRIYAVNHAQPPFSYFDRK